MSTYCKGRYLYLVLNVAYFPIDTFPWVTQHTYPGSCSLSRHIVSWRILITRLTSIPIVYRRQRPLTRQLGPVHRLGAPRYRRHELINRVGYQQVLLPTNEPGAEQQRAQSSGLLDRFLDHTQRYREALFVDGRGGRSRSFRIAWHDTRRGWFRASRQKLPCRVCLCIKFIILRCIRSLQDTK